MGRGLYLLTARFVTTITKPGRYGDGGGLYLLARKRGDKLERLWIFRRSVGKRGAAKEQVVSLGPVRDVSLASARELARACREAVREGRDPRSALPAEDGPDSPTFGQFADGLVDSIVGGFTSQATRANWRRTLGDKYCATLRPKAIDNVDTGDVLEVLRPIWLTHPETARKLRGRIERVLDSAKAEGLRSGENPARWRGHLKLLLPKQPRSVRHHRALPWQELPAFMARLRQRDSLSALALEWTILTVARTSETIEAPRSEIDRSGAVWTLPPERMKEPREHRVPLTPRCIDIFDAVKVFGSDWLFPARDPREHMSSGAMAECLKEFDVDATVHGFRSTFKDWAEDATEFPRELAEAALAHAIGDETERAYRRSDALERRRKMMLAWERYCLSKVQVGNVIELKRG
jgi:integrase